MPFKSIEQYNYELSRLGCIKWLKLCIVVLPCAPFAYIVCTLHVHKHGHHVWKLDFPVSRWISSTYNIVHAAYLCSLVQRKSITVRHVCGCALIEREHSLVHGARITILHDAANDANDAIMCRTIFSARFTATPFVSPTKHYTWQNIMHVQSKRQNAKRISQKSMQ